MLEAMVRNPRIFLAAGLLLWSASCGSSQPAGGGGASEPGDTARHEVPSPPGPQAVGPAPGGPPGPMPMVPPEAGTTEEPPRQEAPAPSIASLDDAEEAAARGYYSEAEAFFTQRSSSGAERGRALLGLARVQLATGRYEEAATTAERAARDRAHRIATETLRGEALARLGRLDEAERVLSAVAGEQEAHRANVLLGRLLQDRGRGAEATTHFMRLIQAYNDETIGPRDAEGLAYVGMAARGLDSFQDANDAFRESNAADPQRVETQIEWARLFLEKYDAGHAEESLRQALERNPNAAEAHALIARVKIEQSFDFAGATAYSERALEIDPNLVMAHVTLAGMDLRDMDFAAANAHLDRALQVDANDLEALSVRAAVRFLADDARGFEQAKREVFRRNRTFSRMYSIIGEYAEWEHRYPEIVQMARDAVTLDPTDAFAHATLGLNLLRMGQEEEGLTALREAWRRDRFNVHVFNTLNLYDDVIGPLYEDFQAGPLAFRMHREERPVLEHYVPPTLRRAWDDMRRRYGFTPEGPVRIELFNDTQHFSVRTTGLPNLGVQGVCFGKVVTAISPAGGPFNWGQITWHELAHVFHIQLSNNRVPRWFTEGLAEYETIVARPEWGREEDHRLYQAIANDRLPPLRLMNRAFTHARSAEDMMTAYYASSQLVKYIVERFGFDKVARMLREWGAGKQTAEVIQRGLGVSMDQLDRDFRQHTLQRLASYADDFAVDFGQYRELEPLRAEAEAAPRDASKQAALAAGLLVSGEAEEAEAAARRAIGIEAAQPVARYVLARIAMAQRDSAAAEEHLRAILSAGRDGYDLRLLLAHAGLARQDMAAARRDLEAAARIDPKRPEAWQGLGAIAERTNDADLRLLTLERLAGIDQHDRQAWAALMTALAERQRWQELADVGESALFLDPHSTEVHRLLGEAYLHTDRARQALAELDVALLTEPEQPGPVHLARARALRALGRRGDAQQAADEAVRADPSLAEEARRVTSAP